MVLSRTHRVVQVPLSFRAAEDERGRNGDERKMPRLNQVP